MTTVCAHHIFEEIRLKCIVAQDIFDHNDKTFSTAEYLWTTWKAPAVTSKYLKHQFYKHPSTITGMAHHLAKNHVTHDDSLASKDTLMEKTVAKIDKTTSTADQVTSSAEKSVTAIVKSLHNVIFRLDQLEVDRNTLQENEQCCAGGNPP
jgi:hypothetical protein